MLTIGLTGGSGAGKGAVCAILEERKIPCINTDAVYREITVPGSACLAELAEAFGQEILTDQRELNRPALSGLVFSGTSRDGLNILNRITHKYILEECRRRLDRMAERGTPIAVVDAPQLYESGFHECCDAVVAVTADRELRIRRIMTRDGVTREAAEKRIAAQHSDAFFRDHADYVIENNDGVENLKNQVVSIIAELTGRGKSHATR